jgi:hypothetical protein
MLSYIYGFLQNYDLPVLAICIHKSLISESLEELYFCAAFDVDGTDYIGETNSIPKFYDNHILVDIYPNISESYFSSKLEFARNQINLILNPKIENPLI